MVFALFRMPYNLLTSLIPVIRYILLCIQQALTVLFFLVLLVLFINISKNLVAFVSKAGAKVRDFILTAKRFRKFFFNFSFYIVSQALLRKGKKVKKKNKPRFFANRTAKIRTFLFIFQNFSEVFFCSWVKQSCALSLSHFHQGFLLSESGCKSTPFQDTKQIYITLFSDYFFIIWLTCWLIGWFKNTAISIQETTKGRIQNYTHYYI